MRKWLEGFVALAKAIAFDPIGGRWQMLPTTAIFTAAVVAALFLLWLFLLVNVALSGAPFWALIFLAIGWAITNTLNSEDDNDDGAYGW